MENEQDNFKKVLLSKFIDNSTFSSKQVKYIIESTSGKSIRPMSKPDRIKKGDVIILTQGAKNRPCVVTRVLKDSTVVFIPLTSTENVHCLTEFKSRFFGEGCFSKSFSVCTMETALENFVGVFDNNKDLNIAIKTLKEYIIKNL